MSARKALPPVARNRSVARDSLQPTRGSPRSSLQPATRDRPLSSLIRTFDHALTDEFCDRLVENFEAIPDVPHHRMSEAWRRCRIVRIIECESWFLMSLRRSLVSVWEGYRLLADPLHVIGANPQLEVPQVVRYRPSAGEHFHDHADTWNTDSATRQVSAVAYLNDVTEGGETVFPHQGVRLRPSKGAIAIFPSNFLYVHRAEPPRSGAKYVILSWLHFQGPTTYASGALVP